MDTKLFTRIVLDSKAPKNSKVIWLNPIDGKLRYKDGNIWKEIAKPEPQNNLQYIAIEDIQGKKYTYQEVPSFYKFAAITVNGSPCFQIQAISSYIGTYIDALDDSTGPVFGSYNEFEDSFTIYYFLLNQDGRTYSIAVRER